MNTEKHEKLNSHEVVLIQNMVHRSRSCDELLLLKFSDMFCNPHW